MCSNKLGRLQRFLCGIGSVTGGSVAKVWTAKPLPDAHFFFRFSSHALHASHELLSTKVSPVHPKSTDLQKLALDMSQWLEKAILPWALGGSVMPTIQTHSNFKWRLEAFHLKNLPHLLALHDNIIAIYNLLTRPVKKPMPANNIKICSFTFDSQINMLLICVTGVDLHRDSVESLKEQEGFEPQYPSRFELAPEWEVGALVGSGSGGFGYRASSAAMFLCWSSVSHFAIRVFTFLQLLSELQKRENANRVDGAAIARDGRACLRAARNPKDKADTSASREQRDGGIKVRWCISIGRFHLCRRRHHISFFLASAIRC